MITGILLAALGGEQFRPPALDEVLRVALRKAPDLELCVLPDATRIDVDEVGIFVRPVERQVGVLAGDGGKLLPLECVLNRMSLHMLLLVVVGRGPDQDNPDPGRLSTLPRPVGPLLMVDAWAIGAGLSAAVRATTTKVKRELLRLLARLRVDHDLAHSYPAIVADVGALVLVEV